MNHLPQAWGRPRDDIYGAYDHSYLQSNPIQHTQEPIVVGGSVVAVKFNGGVVIAADNLAAYGGLLRFPNVTRLRPFGSQAVLGIGGDVSDMQHIDRMLQSLETTEKYSSEGHEMSAKNLHTYLGKVMYKRRTDMNPLWNAILVAGLDNDGEPFLSSVDLLGTTFSAPALATGYGAHLATPLLRKIVEDEADVKNVTRERAVEAVRHGMNVLFLRSARSMDRYSMAVVTKEKGVELSEDEELTKDNWSFVKSLGSGYS